MSWDGLKVLVTGGASFIGSHLVERLVERGATVRVVDDLSSGKLAYIQPLIDSRAIEFVHGTLLEQSIARAAVKDVHTVFHLAADHGGRGYVDLHQVACGTNLALDGLVFWEAERAGVERIVFASSGCIYPVDIQSDVNESIYLSENMAGPPYNADRMYGWAKLMAELQLRELARERGLKTASCRYFTVYGERGKEDHAIIAMIARAFIRQDPFEIWGDGTQIRNWTYVGDIVEGTIATAEHISDGSAINLGTTERTSVRQAAELAIAFARDRFGNYDPELRFLPDMPTGPLNRVADNSLAEDLLGWRPKVMLVAGITKTAEWYFDTHKDSEVAATLTESLTER
ncbi:MAG: UDP-glucose 4-epimerase [Actinomycetota bacterium]|jgi:nucleoside-diphosphate-sugar epimerase|nr:UDP-glucose 4-epimerase [Actinomycetota bacterium]